jgi:hypothetical protein
MPGEGLSQRAQVLVGNDDLLYVAPGKNTCVTLTIEQTMMQGRPWGAPRPAGRDDVRPEESL